MNRAHLYDRVLGSLATACIGDALGAPAEQRSPREIVQLWGAPLCAFEAPPGDSPYAEGRQAGQITDDTSQMLGLVDTYLADGGTLTAAGMARMLLRWSETEYYPRFAGPNTVRAIERLRAGADPERLGAEGRLCTDGTSNGAAMRVAPVGLRYPGDVPAAVADALTNCRPSHLTNIGVAGAAAVAAAVAVAVQPDSTVRDVVAAGRAGAVEGHRVGGEEGRDVAGPSIARRIDLAVAAAYDGPDFLDAVRSVTDVVGSGLGMAEAVPAAFGIFVAAGGDPYLSCVGGANAGDDSDTVACIAGSIAGAFRGFQAVPSHLYQQLLAANDLDLETRAKAFVELVLAGQ
ncbi:MAG: ADP-ribosylglycohydrolase family protein [Geodermatophilaceae bacterium]